MKDLSPKHKQIIYIIIGIVAVAIICVGVFQYSSSKNNENMLEASTSYQKALIANENPNISTANKIAKFESVTKLYSNTSYGILASWQIADLYSTPEKLDSSKKALNDDDNKAIQVLLKSTSDNPNDDLTNITKTKLAKLYIQTNQVDEAIKSLQSLPNLDNNAYPLMILGQAYAQQGDKAKALQTWKKAIQDPNSTPEFKQVISQFINNTN